MGLVLVVVFYTGREFDFVVSSIDTTVYYFNLVTVNVSISKVIS